MLRTDLLEPRDPETAIKFAVPLCVVAGGLSTVATIFVPQDLAFGLAPIVATSMAMVVIGLLLAVVSEQVRRWLWLPVPLLGVATIVVASLGTHDASAGGQVFFCAPVLFAASQLRTESAWFVTACAVASVSVIAGSLLPFERALTDIMFVSSALVLITWLLVRAGDRNDELMEELRAQAAIDPLTGLVTRRVLDKAATSVLTSSNGDGGTSLIVLDVDKFKTINDTWGHPAGDAALVHLAEVLQSRCRPDTVLSRLGGDELALLLPGCPYDVAVQRAQELVDAVRESPLHLPEGVVVPLSISVGVAHAPLHAERLRDLYAAADASLYDAKRNGRGRVGEEMSVPERGSARA